MECLQHISNTPRMQQVIEVTSKIALQTVCAENSTSSTILTYINAGDKTEDHFKCAKWRKNGEKLHHLANSLENLQVVTQM